MPDRFIEAERTRKTVQASAELASETINSLRVNCIGVPIQS